MSGSARPTTGLSTQATTIVWPITQATTHLAVEREVWLAETNVLGGGTLKFVLTRTFIPWRPASLFGGLSTAVRLGDHVMESSFFGAYR
jgi:hypothetical protein